MPCHVLIGGGTGFIGSRLSQFLLQRGCEVTVLSRQPANKRMTWIELENNGIPDGVTAVVNVAGQNVLDPKYRWNQTFQNNVWNSRITTSEQIVNAIQRSKSVRTFVNICGVSHYKPNDKVYTEADSVEGFDFMSKLCLEWEKASTLPADLTERIQNIKLRTGAVIGRNGGMIKSIWLPFILGLGGPIGSGNQMLPWIHIEDLCRLILHCLDSSKHNGPLNAVAPDIVTNAEFSKIFASTLRRPCLFQVPEFVIKMIFGKERSSLLLTGAKIQPAAALADGFIFKYPTVVAACQEIIQK